MKKVIYLSLVFAFCFGNRGTLSNRFMKGCGVLIHPSVVLTSAHVLYKQVNVTFDEKFKGKVFCHPSYKKVLAPSIICCENDIALFILDAPILHGSCMPLGKKFHQDKVIYREDSLSYGDSGSPLIFNEKVIGIASAIVRDKNGKSNVIYTCVFPHLFWIQKTIEENL